MTRFDIGRQTREQRAGLLVVIGLLSLLLWQTAIGSIVLYPFTILATWFHEMGHGLTSMLTGSEFERLVIYADGSGQSLSRTPVDQSRFADALVAAGGPLGPPLAGAGLILASRTAKSSRIALSILGAALLASCLIWVRSLVGLAVLAPFGAALLALAWKGSRDWSRFGVQVLGVEAAISTWQHLGYLFTAGGVVGGISQRSDTQVIADALVLPYWFWGGAISLGIALLLWWSLRRALR
ncbi:M50 family metallopeptidase [Blastomonas marina]|uniref:M50 family metallopeptidase n=1 Tax=Blastomonas marina TaxID=1867408 RepID=UPI001E5045D9|nr:M50 family metallopeptidase [Blastomonas marina]